MYISFLPIFLVTSTHFFSEHKIKTGNANLFTFVMWMCDKLKSYSDLYYGHIPCFI